MTEPKKKKQPTQSAAGVTLRLEAQIGNTNQVLTGHEKKVEKLGSKLQAANREIPKHRQCPSCFGRLKGIGTGTSTQGNKAFYKCTTCGHNWTVIVTNESVEIQHRVTEVIERHSNNPETPISAEL